MNILGIETSCDETAAAVVSGRDVLSSVVFSQVKLHRPYGGVVPEIASRSHLETLPGVVQQALDDAGLRCQALDGIAVTFGPGLATSLLVGLSMAKGLALSLGRSLIPVNHLEAHIYSAFVGRDAPLMDDVCPFVALVVSGGHTSLYLVEGIGRYRLLGRTIDDAAGEAFDKGAMLLGLGYPGGPVVDRLAKTGDPRLVRFPRGRQGRDPQRTGGLDAELCFSFSGLKTALLYHLRDHPLSPDRSEVPSLAASYQEAIVDALIGRCARALRGVKALAVVGGVALNSRLRERAAELARTHAVRLLLAEPRYCADNAAMVAAVAGAGGGLRGEDAMERDVESSAAL